MENQPASLIAWSFGIAASGYLLFAVYLFSLGAEWRHSTRPRALLLAMLISACWAGLGTAFALTNSPLLLLANTLADFLRYGCWYVFLILLLAFDKRSGETTRPSLASWLTPACWVAVISGIALHLALGFSLISIEHWARTVLFQALLMILLGLILVEQLFRNVSEDSRWNVKPLCLGLGGLFIFDLYLYSDALMFNRIDPDALAVRGFVNTLVIPLFIVSTLRSRDWTSKIRLSQKAAFHSATLLIAGLYLLFMSGIGYYVRYFGGDWGRAFQLGIALSLVFWGWVILVVSGSMRAKLRVLVGKHFFNYRYDYREEWLKFHPNPVQRRIRQKPWGNRSIRGLANMVESPGRWALVTRSRAVNIFCQAARWNMPAEEAEREDFDSPSGSIPVNQRLGH